ncbi:MAG: VWA domain-containing protein [Nitrospirae bacterium]|nr:VWA domain-containing protein [Nitrospirota bacterium]MBF0590643.1 VWA domain-containing protein [Nitrospirota bacterium]
MSFKDPWILILIPFLCVAVWYGNRRRALPAVRFSSGTLLRGLGQTFRVRAARNMVFLRLATLVLLLIGLARPLSVLEQTNVNVEGIDIAIAIDLSSSMLAEDLARDNNHQNRLDAVKEVVRDFIGARTTDRIALVEFSGVPYMASPLTTDYGYLLAVLDRARIGMIQDGTAIGSALAMSIARLKDTKAKSKVVVLLTDGRNNMGSVSPLTAAQAAAALNIKVYTVGAGAKGPVPYPVKDPFGNIVYRPAQIDLDDELLTEIARLTGGRYFRATDFNSLKGIYKEIDTLEKTPFEEKRFYQYRELFMYFVAAAMVLILSEILLGQTLLRRLP